MLRIAIVSVLLAVATSATAGVHLAKDEALALAFPDATVVASNVVLSAEQVARAEEALGGPVPSKLITYYRAERDGKLVGHAIIDAHVVRTLPEALLITVDAAGKVDRVLVLAFHEPPEYEASARWLEQFRGRQASDERWRLGRDVHGITGATLTAHAVTAAIHRTVVLLDVMGATGITP